MFLNIESIIQSNLLLDCVAISDLYLLQDIVLLNLLLFYVCSFMLLFIDKLTGLPQKNENQNSLTFPSPFNKIP